MPQAGGTLLRDPIHAAAVVIQAYWRQHTSCCLQDIVGHELVSACQLPVGIEMQSDMGGQLPNMQVMCAVRT